MSWKRLEGVFVALGDLADEEPLGIDPTHARR